jgi:hypothetical protein
LKAEHLCPSLNLAALQGSKCLLSGLPCGIAQVATAFAWQHPTLQELATLRRQGLETQLGSQRHEILIGDVMRQATDKEPGLVRVTTSRDDANTPTAARGVYHRWWCNYGTPHAAITEIHWLHCLPCLHNLVMDEIASGRRATAIDSRDIGCEERVDQLR